MRHPGFRAQFITYVLAMMADNIEHVISYWVLFQKFHSPALAGFAVLSHWLPFLLFSVAIGVLADRVDPRRIIQCGMGLFITASLGWGYFFITGTLQMWHAVVLLIIHGCAGVLWQTPNQLLLYDIVGPADLISAVRLNATARYLGVLVGPAVGGVIMLTLGPSHGIVLNTIFYLPMLLWLINAPYRPRFRTDVTPPPTRAVRGLADIVQTIRDVSPNSVIASMTLLAGVVVLRRQRLQRANAGICPGSRPWRSRCHLQHAVVGRRRWRAARRRYPRRSQSDAAQSAHGDRLGDAVVWGAHRVCAVIHLSVGVDPVVRRRIFGAVIQFHGANPGAT